MKTYREWIYKIVFWFCCQVAAWTGLFLSGDVFYKEGAEFDITIQESKSS